MTNYLIKLFLVLMYAWILMVAILIMFAVVVICVPFAPVIAYYAKRDSVSLHI